MVIKLRNLIVTMFMLFIIDSSLYANQYQTTVAITADKKQYLLNEMMMLKLKATNLSKEGPNINFDSRDQLIIENERGIRCKFYGIHFDGLNRMSENETREYLFEITGVFDNNREIKAYQTNQNMIVPGKYIIKYIYKEDGFQPINSNEVRIEILEPIGDELKAFNIFLSAYNLVPYLDDASTQKALRSYNYIIETYPNSVYVLNSLMEKVFLLKTMNGPPRNEEIANTTEKLLLREPEYSRTNYYIKMLLKAHKNKNTLQKGRDFLMKLQDKSTDEKRKNIIRENLERIEN